MAKKNRSLSKTDSQLAVHSAAWAGPLPPPGTLARFEEVLPGSAERIVARAEANARDRFESDRIIRQLSSRGQVFAFILTAAALGIGFWLLLHDKSTAGIVAILGALGVPIAAFLGLKYSKS